MTNAYPGLVDAAVKGLRRFSSARPRVGIVLGSGLSDLAASFGGQSISYGDIPGFPAPGVAGHAGVLNINESVAVMAGRFHFYEGHSWDTVLLPVGLLCKLGVEVLILTNAAGSINPANIPGSLVLLKDHINFQGSNPLAGPHLPGFGPRFPDMSEVYSRRLRSLAKTIEPGLGEGVYLAVSGPSYETPAEIKAFQVLGADLVGMSTVPEAILSRACGVETMAISLVTNLAAGLGAELNHAEVMAEGKKAAGKLENLLHGLVEKTVQGQRP